MAERAAIVAKSADARATAADIRVGLIGHGIQLSRTPRMHMEEGAAQGLSYRYDLFDIAGMDPVPPLTELLATAEGQGYAGLNITHPFKQEVVPHLDHLSDAARAVNAVNTVVFRDGARLGHNTDYWGFAEAFRRTMADVAQHRVLLLGAGGAGSAVANALIDAGVARLAIFDPSRDAAARLVADLAARAGEGAARVAAGVAQEMDRADGIVNASPVGMASHPGSPAPVERLQPRHWVADIIYFPLETELLAAARGAGCRAMDGSGMAVFQAVRAFELFTGVAPDAARMRATFDAFAIPSAGSPED